MKRALSLLILVAVVSPVRADVPVPATLSQEEGTSGKGSRSRRPPSPIPELPPEQLPPATAAKPDPKREQFSRAAVFVAIDEEIQPRKRDAYRPKHLYVQTYLSEYFRRAGYPIVGAPEKAVYRVEGSFRARYLEELVFRGQRIALKFRSSAFLVILDRAGKELGRVDIPELDGEGILPRKKSADGKGPPEESNAVRDLRREMAKLLWDHLFHRVDPFRDPEIPALISSLAQDPLESEGVMDANEVIQRLAARRLEAVPYLLDALSDERNVMVSAEYPGLTTINSEKLRIYHIADKALEEIFQKVSRMNLDTPRKYRYVIIRGWENEWKRFCKPFRESPHSGKSPEDSLPAASRPGPPK